MSKEEQLKFQPVPIAGRIAYGAMTHGEFMDFTELVSGQNNSWFRQNADPRSIWAVVVNGEIVGQGKAMPFPDEISIRGYGTATAFPPYLVIKNVTPRDIRLMLQRKNKEAVRKTLGASEADFETHYENKDLGLVTLSTQSGALNKLSKDFALGRVRVLSPKGHTAGATTLVVWNRDYGSGRKLYVASQIEQHVHARGGKIAEERYPDQFLRVERRHRFDDPLIDLMDTYEMVRETGWPDLMIYRNREKYTTVRFPVGVGAKI